MKLLVVDDEYFFRKALIATIPLKDFGITECLEAENGKMALEVVEKEQPDIIFADINMPQMNGLAFIERVRQLDYSPTIIIISGYDEFDYVKKGLYFGIKDYLLKPINEKELFEVLGTVIQNIKKKQMEELDLQHLEQTVYRNQQIVKEYFLNKLLHCKTIDEYDAFQEQYMQINKNRFEYNTYTVVSLKMFGYDGEESSLYQFIVSNVISEKIGDISQNIVCMDGDNLVVILVVDLSPEELRSVILKIKECQALFLERLQLFTCVGIGNIKEHYWEIRESYVESLEAVSSHVYWQENKVILYGYYNEEEKVFESRDKRLLERAIYDQNTVEIEELLDQVFFEMKERNVSLEIYKTVMKELFQFLGEFRNREDFKLEKSVKREFGFLLSQSKAIEDSLEAKSYLYCMCRILCENGEEKIVAYPEVVKKIVEMIEIQYSDYELSVERIAKEMFMNYNYLCVLFKKNVGVTINDYITKTRMKKALELLEKGEVQIGELSQKCGYLNVGYFTKCFKKEFGVPPSRYVVNRQ